MDKIADPLHLRVSRYDLGDTTLLRDVDLVLHPGELTVLTGATGAGKTSLLHLLAGLTPFDGTRTGGGSVAFVPQDRRLVARWTAAENVAVVAPAGPALELEGAWNRLAGGLSAGQVARLQLLRALAGDPSVLLVDEPTGNLDAASAALVIERLVQESRTRAVLVATHDANLTAAADRILVVRDGHLHGPPPAPAAGVPRARRTQPSMASLAWDLTRGRRGAALAAAMAAAITVALVVFFLAATRGGTEFLTENVLGQLPTGMVRVVPPRLALGPIEFEVGEDRLGPHVEGQLAALPGVTAVHPQRFANFPLALRIAFLGQSLSTDAALEGLRAQWLADDIDPDRFTWNPGEPIPAVVSTQLLSMFNAGFASSQGLPRVKASALKRLTVDATLGRSSFGRVPGPPERVSVRVLGVSDRVSPIALAVPLEVVEHYAKQFDVRRGRPVETAWSSAVLELGDADETLGLSDAVEELGLRLEDDAGPAATLARAIHLLQRAGGGVGWILTTVAAVLLGLLLRSRVVLNAPDVDVLESIGVAPSVLFRAALVDVLAVSGVGAMAGLFGAWSLVGLLEGTLSRALREATGIRPEDLLAITSAEAAVSLVVPVVAVALTAPLIRSRMQRPLLDRLRSGSVG